MKKYTLFLKLAILLISVPLLALAVSGLFWLVQNPVSEQYDHVLYPILSLLYLSLVPIFYTLFNSFTLLNVIEKWTFFSKKASELVGTLKRSNIILSGLYVILLPFVFGLAQLDDAPGLVIIGAFPLFLALVSTATWSVLRLLIIEKIETES